jgi:hypothetical protein
MPQKSIVTRNSEQDQQLQNELLGDWYNYEPEDMEIDSRQVNHWLDSRDQSLKLLSPQRLA